MPSEPFVEFSMIKPTIKALLCEAFTHGYNLGKNNDYSNGVCTYGGAGLVT